MEDRKSLPCYYDEELLIQFVNRAQSEESLPDDLLRQLSEASPQHLDCEEADHNKFRENVSHLINKELMIKFMQATDDKQGTSKLIELLLDGSGLMLLQVLLKFGTRSLSHLNEFYKVLSYILMLRRHEELKAQDLTRYYAVCSVCVKLITDICRTDYRTNSHGKPLIIDCITGFTVFIPSLLLERAECVDQKLQESICSLILESVRSYCTCAMLSKSIAVVTECGLVVVVEEVATVHLSLSQKLSTTGIELQVTQTSLLGLLQLAEVLLSKLQTFNQTMILVTDLLKLMTKLLQPHVQMLVKYQKDEEVSHLVNCLLSMVKQLKQTKVRYSHSQKCTRKKHKHCKLEQLTNHHHRVLDVKLSGSITQCAVSCITKLVLDIYKSIPVRSTFKVDILAGFSSAVGCCCMKQSDFIHPLFSDLIELTAKQQEVVVTIFSQLLIHQLACASNVTDIECSSCIHHNVTDSYHQTADIAQVLPYMSKSQSLSATVLRSLIKVNNQTESCLLFDLYTCIYLPTLEKTGNDDIVTSLCLVALDYCLTLDDCVDHFMSSVSRLNMLSSLANEKPQMVPLLLNVSSRLVIVRGDTCTVNLSLSLILGQPEIDEHLSLVHCLPSFSDTNMDLSLFIDKWQTCLKLLELSNNFRFGFEAQNGTNHILKLLRILIQVIPSSDCSQKKYRLLLQSLTLVLRCGLTCVDNLLVVSKQVLVLKDVLDVIKEEMITCFGQQSATSNHDTVSYDLLATLLECSVKVESTYQSLSSANQAKMTSYLSGPRLSCSRQTESSDNLLSDCEDKLSSSESEYEADDESFSNNDDVDDSHITPLNTYSKSTYYPDIWLLVTDLLTTSQVQQHPDHHLSVLTHLEKFIRSTRVWTYSSQKTDLGLKLVSSYKSEVMNENSQIGATILSIVEYTLKENMHSKLLSSLLTALYHSSFKSHILRRLHHLVTHSTTTPSHSLSFPLDKGDNEDSPVILSHLEYESMAYSGCLLDLSCCMWLYLDGCLCAGCASNDCGRKSVNLLTLNNSNLSVVLQCEANSGTVYIQLRNNLIADVNDQAAVPMEHMIPSVLTTNKWQMISLSVRTKAKDSVAAEVDCSVGVDGGVVFSESNIIKTSSQLFIQSSDNKQKIDVCVGQRSNRNIQEHTVHISNVTVFKGDLNKLQVAGMYILGPRYDLYADCVGQATHGSLDTRLLACDRLDLMLTEYVLANLDRLHVSNGDIKDQIMLVMGPKYKPYNMAYTDSASSQNYRCKNHLHRIAKLLPAAYDKGLSTVSHDQLDFSLSVNGGIDVLLFLYAKTVEMELSEESQLLALECLLHTNNLIHSSSLSNRLDYLLLSKLLSSNQCTISSHVTQVLIDYSIKRSEDNSSKSILLVDLTFISQVLLDWRIWQTHTDQWLHILGILCDSMSDSCRYRELNCRAILECGIIPKAVSIPQEQYHKESGYPLSSELIRHICLLTYRVMSFSKDPKLLGEISNLVLLLHPAASTYVQYDTGRLYPAQHWAAPKRSRHTATPAAEDEDGLLSNSNEFVIVPPQTAEEQTKIGYASEEAALSDYSTGSVTLSASETDDSKTELLEEKTLSFAKSSGHHQPTRSLLNTKQVDKALSLEDALSALSSYLLQAMYLTSGNLNPASIHIFCVDLMTLESLTVFLNHEDLSVIHISLQMLFKVAEMSSFDQLDWFITKNGFHLVASQLHQLQSNASLLELCIKLSTSQLFDKCYGYRKDLAMPLLLPLMGSLYQCTHSCSLFNKAIIHILKLFEDRAGTLPYAISNGLLNVLTNCIYGLITQDHGEAENLNDCIASLTTLLQLCVQHLVMHAQAQSIKDMMVRMLVLERKVRRLENKDSSDRTDTVQALETLIGKLYQSVYDCIKHETSIITKSSIVRSIFNKVRGTSIREGSKDETRQDSNELAALHRSTSRRGSLTSSFTESLSSWTSAIVSSGSSAVKGNPGALKELLHDVIQDYLKYCMYKAPVSYNDTENLPEVMKLLLDCLLPADSTPTLWTDITASLRPALWQVFSMLMTYILSASCDKLTADATINVVTNLSDSVQRTIVTSFPVCDSPHLLANLRSFLNQIAVRSSHESFLISLLTKLNNPSSAHTQQRQLSKLDSGVTDISLSAEWLDHHQTKRAEWKLKIHQIRHRAFHNCDILIKKLSHSAMEINTHIVHKQNLERKRFIQQVKNQLASDISVNNQWRKVILTLTSERCIWHDSNNYPTCWKIDPTEGPCRVRKKLQRCRMDGVAEKFLLDKSKHKVVSAQATQPLDFLFQEGSQSESASAALIFRLHTNETISYTCKCSNITPNLETFGDLLISEYCIHFVGDAAVTDIGTNEAFNNAEMLCISWPLSEIKGFYSRRYQLQDNAIEIFFISGRTCLLAVDSTKERDELWNVLDKLDLPARKSSVDLEFLQRQWVSGHMTNFEYLTHLNTTAGRSFNDLMQYPVFPFVLSDYQSHHLDLTNPNVYRKLNKPIACQVPENEEKYKIHYQAIQADIELARRNPDNPHHAPIAPYHYGSHYSNSGVVLYYLVRLLPYTQMFLKYQDGQFDIPDRTFHSMHTSWLLSSERSSTDVKELIPEFFYLPEFLLNDEDFNFGKRHSGEQVLDVNLPGWCAGDARSFVLIMRQALESRHVTKSLHGWINLIFGYQQQGKAAEEAVNKFHPATYFGLEVNSIEDELQRNAIKVMIRTYGQMPKQLFTSRHPESLASILQETPQSITVPVLESVTGLSWGAYVGSPADATEPVVVMNEEQDGISSLIAVATGEIIGLSPSSVIVTHETKSKRDEGALVKIWAAMVSWSQSDSILRIKYKATDRPVNFLHTPFKVTSCTGHLESGLLLIASDIGLVQVHQVNYCSDKISELSWHGIKATLVGHKSAITSLHISAEFSIIVSTDADGLCIIWELNKLTYVRSIETECQSKIECAAISATLGDIILSSVYGKGSVIELYTINAKFVASITLTDRVRCLCYSTAPEGQSVNVIAGALSNGTIQLWSSWDLKPVKTFSIPNLWEPFTSCVFTKDNTRLAACTCSGRIIVWERANNSQLYSSNKLRYLSLH